MNTKKLIDIEKCVAHMSLGLSFANHPAPLSIPNNIYEFLIIFSKLCGGVSVKFINLPRHFWSY